MESVVSGFNASNLMKHVFDVLLLNKTHIIMIVKLTHHGGHIIYVKIF
jgi:hypothetical protein